MSNSEVNPPLARHEALQPFSREHFNGLVLARQLRDAAEADDEQRRQLAHRIDRTWDLELDPHFSDEEDSLEEIMTDAERNRLQSEHATLREAVRAVAQGAPPASTDMLRLSELLQQHIRWEERELFPAVQARATPEQMKRIAALTDHIEDQRPGARKRQDPRGACHPALGGEGQ